MQFSSPIENLEIVKLAIVAVSLWEVWQLLTAVCMRVHAAASQPRPVTFPSHLTICHVD